MREDVRESPFLSSRTRPSLPASPLLPVLLGEAMPEDNPRCGMPWVTVLSWETLPLPAAPAQSWKTCPVKISNGCVSCPR